MKVRADIGGGGAVVARGLGDPECGLGRAPSGGPVSGSRPRPAEAGQLDGGRSGGSSNSLYPPGICKAAETERDGGGGGDSDSLADLSDEGILRGVEAPVGAVAGERRRGGDGAGSRRTALAVSSPEEADDDDRGGGGGGGETAIGNPRPPAVVVVPPGGSPTAGPPLILPPGGGAEAPSVLDHLQSWFAGGLSFCTMLAPQSRAGIFLSAIPEAAKGEDEPGSAGDYVSNPQRGKGGGFRSSGSGSAVEEEEAGDQSLPGLTLIITPGRKDGDGGGNFDPTAKTIKRRNGGRGMVVDVTIDKERENGKVPPLKKAICLENPMPVAIVTGEGSFKSVDACDDGSSGRGAPSVRLTMAIRDPALLTGSHYLGWDGRRSHYTLFSDQITALDETNARKVDTINHPLSPIFGGSLLGTTRSFLYPPHPPPLGGPPASDRRVNNHSFDTDEAVTSPRNYWTSPEAESRLGDAVAVIHIISSPRSRSSQRRISEKRNPAKRQWDHRGDGSVSETSTSFTTEASSSGEGGGGVARQEGEGRLFNPQTSPIEVRARGGGARF